MDGRLAPALQSALQRFAKPWYRMRALRIFRDDASLSTNPALWGSITQALDESAFFLLLASPEAAGSPWVRKEVEYWREHKPHDHLLIALTDGVVVWDLGRRDFVGSELNAMPSTIRGVFREEPRYTDLTWARKADNLSLSDPRFRSDVADIAAALHGRPKDELVGEEVRQHRRTVRMALAAGGVLAVLAAAATVAAVFAVDQRNDARAERDLATSRYLAAQARSEFAADVPRALLLSMAALGITDTAEARGALRAGLQRTGPELVSVLESSQATAWMVAFGPDQRLVTAGSDHITVWHVGNRRRDGPPLPGGNSTIFTAALSPDGKTLVSGHEDGTLSFWDLERRRRLGKPIKAHPGGAVLALAFSPDGRTVASGGMDLAVRFWDVERRSKGEAPLPFAYFVFSQLSFGPGGRTLATVHPEAGIALWDLDRRGAPKTLVGQGDENVRTLALERGGRVLASGNEDGTITLWDVRRLEQIGKPLRGHRVEVVHMDFSPDGGLLASIDDTGVILLWDVERHRRIGPLRGHAGTVLGVAFGPDGRALASGGDDEIVLWDVGRRRLAAPIRGHIEFVEGIAFSPDGRTLASGSSADGELSLWNVATRRRRGAPIDADDGITSVGYIDDAAVATGYILGDIALWDLPRRQSITLETGSLEEVSALAFDRDAGLLVSGSADSKVALWDVERMRRIGKPLRGHRGEVLSVALSPDGTMIASGDSNGTILLWDVARRRRVGMLRGHTGSVLSVAFGQDGRTVVSGSDREVLLWDLNTGDRSARRSSIVVASQSEASRSAPIGAWPPSDSSTARSPSGTSPAASSSAVRHRATAELSSAWRSAPAGSCSRRAAPTELSSSGI